ncbi:hypothetical protein MED01_002446 [Micromonospora sp. MED01]|uniref:hypothetical protein n=1 Tax=Micromonospora alfalfae TaxID=2911212 RepID=UPI001EE8D180|nr:hypothetical protein [Micromonospora alfalfae]MCG5464280.1 hypothetical protein [Micromonospora alfalfae]
MDQTAKTNPTNDELLAALVAGARTVEQVAEALRWSEPPVCGMKNTTLRRLLRGLVVDDLACMRWQFRRLGCDYVPTKKGRERAAQVAVKAAAN